MQFDENVGISITIGLTSCLQMYNENYNVVRRSMEEKGNEQVSQHR